MVNGLFLLEKVRKKEHGSIELPVMRLLTAWCLTADLLSFAIYPFYELENTAKLQFPIFFLVFSLQILFLVLFEHFLRNRYPLPERLILPISLGVYTFTYLKNRSSSFCFKTPSSQELYVFRSGLSGFVQPDHQIATRSSGARYILSPSVIP